MVAMERADSLLSNIKKKKAPNRRYFYAKGVSKTKIFIDAGHNDSGWNTGAVGNGLKEQDITFAVAKKLSNLLTARGLTIKLSRSTKETNLGTNNSSAINARYNMANEWGADYFISIHCNAGGGTGTETLYYKSDSLNYATTIQDAFIKAMKLRDRGIKYTNNIGVIMHTKMPAILIELAFIDTGADALVLVNKQDDMAAALAAGFYELLGMEAEEVTQEQFESMYAKMIAKGKGDNPSTWAKKICEAAKDAGIFEGDGSGNYNWQDPVTREALASVLKNAGIF